MKTVMSRHLENAEQQIALNTYFCNFALKCSILMIMGTVDLDPLYFNVDIVVQSDGPKELCSDFCEQFINILTIISCQLGLTNWLRIHLIVYQLLPTDLLTELSLVS